MRKKIYLLLQTRSHPPPKKRTNKKNLSQKTKDNDKHLKNTKFKNLLNAPGKLRTLSRVLSQI